MQGKKTFSPKMLYQVHLDNLVAKDNFYRKLSEGIDLHFLYDETKDYYGTEGQESIDPVVFFKICLVGYFNNINSDRKLIEHCSNCLDVRLFLLYDIDEELPWHSTISRTRGLYGEEVFLSLFKKVLSLCVDKGMVRGKRQAIDSAYVKANASMDSLAEKEVIEKDAEQYADELNEGSEYQVTKETKKWVEQHHKWKAEEYKDMPGNFNSKKEDEFGNLIRPKFVSNHTHFSTTDHDARVSVKPGKARQLNYLAQVAVDDSHHVITAALGMHADKRDSQCLPTILDQAIENLREQEIEIEQIAADTGYSSGTALKHCEKKNIDAYIPNFGQYKNSREGFIYNKEQDQYECTRGNKAILPLKRTAAGSKGYMMKTYRSSETVCKNCPLRKECIGARTNFKKIDDSIDKPYYDKMHEKMQTAYAKTMSKIRSKTVEPVLGTLINHRSMKRVNSRGIAQANKHIIMAALTYNLKKYINFISKKTVTKAQALQQELNALFFLIIMLLYKDIISKTCSLNIYIKNYQCKNDFA